MIRMILMVVLSLAMLPAALEAAQSARHPAEKTLRLDSFGILHIYRNTPHPTNVVLFFSGEEGWTQTTAEMAKELASLDSLVVGVDINHYLRWLATDGDECSYYSSDLEDLSHYVQQELRFPHYIFPILIGYSSGATLTYASLIQTPTGTLRGAMSLGFCPGMLLPKPPCPGSGLRWKKPGKGKSPRGEEYVFEPAPDLVIPWIVFQGDADTVCRFDAAASFVKQTGHARIVELPKVGHRFSVEADWKPQLKQEFESLVQTLEQHSLAPKAPDVKDLPLVEIPASGTQSDMMAIVISGDGGWAGIDRGLGQTLSGNGISVVGVNTLQYFWTRRTPDSAAADLNRIMRHYLAAWNKRRVILAGYSMGADVLPFMTDRLPADLLSRVALIALLGLSPTVDFEFHFTGWFGNVARKTDLRVKPEVEKLKGKEILCIYGVEEEDSLCKTLAPGLVRLVPMKDGHHFGGDYKAVAEVILKEALGQ